jgi:hypothetical protein
MAKMKLEPGEQVLKEGSVGYLKSRIRMLQGRAYLTDQRFVHTNNARGVAVGGLFGALMKPQVDLDLQLGAITRMTRDEHGRNKEVLKIGTGQGEEHRLILSLDEWLPAFSDALAEHHGTKLLETEPGVWTATRG